MIVFYGYEKCSTCRKAKKALDSMGVTYDYRDITVNPPPASILGKILSSGEYTATELLNRSGVMYREMNMKERIKGMDRDTLVKLLAGHGKLVKRPVVTDGKRHTVGYDEKRFMKAWKHR